MGEWENMVRLKFFCLNPDFERFSSTISRFKCGLCGKTLIALWRRGVVAITTAQLNLTKPELRFCTGSNPAGGVSEICDDENL